MIRKNFSITVIGQLMTALISLVIQIFIARVLLPESRGEYAIIITYSALIVLFTFLGNEYGIRYRFNAEILSLQKTLQNLIQTCLIGLFLGLFLALILAALLNNIALGHLIFGVIYSYCFLFSRQLNVLHSLSMNFTNSAKLLVIEEFLRLMFIYVGFQINPSILSILIASSIPSILIFIYSMKLFRVKKLKLFELAGLKSAYASGLKSALYTLSNFGQIHLLIIILSQLQNNVVVGIFSVAIGLISRIQMIPDSLNRVLVPYMKGGLNIELFKSFVILLTVLMIMLSSLLIFAKSFIIDLLFGAEYAAMNEIYVYLLLSYFWISMRKPYEALLNECLGRPLFVATANASLIAVASLIFLYTVHYYSLKISCISYSIVMFFGWLFYFLVFIRQNWIKFNRRIDIKMLKSSLNDVLR